MLRKNIQKTFQQFWNPNSKYNSRKIKWSKLFLREKSFNKEFLSGYFAPPSKYSREGPPRPWLIWAISSTHPTQTPRSGLVVDSVALRVFFIGSDSGSISNKKKAFKWVSTIFNNTPPYLLEKIHLFWSICFFICL